MVFSLTGPSTLWRRSTAPNFSRLMALATSYRECKLYCYRIEISLALVSAWRSITYILHHSHEDPNVSVG